MFVKAITAAALLLLAGAAHAQSFGVTGIDTNPALKGAAAPDGWSQANADAAKAAEEALKAAPVARTGMTEGGAYTLGAGDKVRVTVFGEEELSGEFEIDSTGVLAMPLVGEANVGNKTLREAERQITKMLAEGYLVNPRVNIEVLNFRPFFILGEVNKPGSYPYVNDMAVINAVALAGGYTPRAKTGRVLIKRASDPSRKEVEAAEDAKVFPGDAIRVDERFF